MTDRFTTPAGRAEPRHNRWGQYLLPDPVTGVETAYTRVTTFAKAISDMEGLTRWKMRMVAKGVATRPDLYALAASTGIEDKQAFEKLTEDALEAAKASTGRNLGTALHSFTEQLDLGEELTVPEPWDKDIAAYRAALANAGIKILPEWVERVVLIPGYGIAGTLDRIVELADGTRVIADLKTGSNIDYGWLEIAVQLACYGYAEHMAGFDCATWQPMPKVDLDKALVIHLPAGKGICDLYDVDIDAGWEAAYICRNVRDWRKRRDLAGLHTVAFPQRPEADPLLGQILLAGDREAMERLWSRNMERWTPAHTKAAEERLAALGLSAGEAGGAEEEEKEGAAV